MEIIDPPEQEVFQLRYSVLKSQSINGSLYLVLWFTSTPQNRSPKTTQTIIDNIMSIEGVQFLKVNRRLTKRFQSPGKPLIVYEYKKLQTLRQVISSGPFTDPTLQSQIIFGVANGMHILHRKHIHHGSLNDRIVFLDQQYRPYISDFGYVHQYNIMNNNFAEYAIYVPPELMKQKHLRDKGKIQKQNFAADVYSFGMLCHFIASGNHIFSRKFRNQPIERLIYNGQRPILPGSVSLQIRDLVNSCTNHLPENRPGFKQIVHTIIRNAEFLFLNADLNRFFSYVDESKSRRVRIAIQKKDKKDQGMGSSRSSRSSTDLLKIIYSCLTEKGQQEAKLSISIQSLLFELNDKNLKRQYNYFLASFADKQDRFTQFCRNLIIVIRINYLHIRTYADFMILLCKKFPDMVKILEEEIFRLVSTYTAIDYVPNMQFLYHLVKNDFFEKGYISNTIQKLKQKKYSSFYLCLMFCYFAKEIENENPQLFDELLKLFEKCSKLSNFHEDLRNFFPKINELRQKNWKPISTMIENRASMPTIKGALMNDDIHLLCELMIGKDINMLVDSDVFDPCPLAHNSLPVICWASIYGAVDCFKYLQLNGAKLYIKSPRSHNLLHYIIANGNKDILVYAIQTSLLRKGILLCTIEFFRNEFYDAYLGPIMKKMFKRDPSARNINSVSASCNNVHILLDILENHPKQKEIRYFDRSPMHDAADHGSIDALSILINVKDAEINCRDIWEMTPLHIAAISDLACTKVLCCHPDIDINAQDLKGHTALHLAVKHRQYDIIKYLLNETHIDSGILDARNRTAYDIACMNNYTDILHLFGQ